AERDGALRELQIDTRRRREGNRDAVALDRLIADASHAHRVRTADLEALYVVVAIRARDGAAAKAAVPVRDLYLRILDRLAGGVSDGAGDGAGGHALRGDTAGKR